MEELKKNVHDLLNTKADHLPLLQRINELVLTNYCISFGGYLKLTPKDVEIYYVNRNAKPPYVDTNMQCITGLKSNVELVKSRCGITLEQIQALETSAEEAARMNAEVEALREEVSRKATIANRKLDEVKKNMMSAKRLIKNAFDPSKWVELGVMDKR